MEVFWNYLLLKAMKKFVTRKHKGEDISIGRISPRFLSGKHDLDESVQILEIYNSDKQLLQRDNDWFVFRYDAKANEFMLDQKLQFLSLKRPKELTKVYEGINEKFRVGISLDEFIEVLFNEYFIKL